MKALMYWIMTIGIIILAVLITMSISPPAHATGGHHDGDTYITNKYYYNKSSHDNTAQSVVLGVVLTCGVRSIYTKSTAGRWTWCGDLPKPKPTPEPGPVLNDVTPDSIFNNNYLIEAK